LATPCVTGTYSNQLNYHTLRTSFFVPMPSLVSLSQSSSGDVLSKSDAKLRLFLLFANFARKYFHFSRSAKAE
ncbi:MAG: hypothetical protein MJZ01_08460, partial [Bacteroidales bacterium]|nr:hypothetical protein [Bacteroidales bacterium]